MSFVHEYEVFPLVLDVAKLIAANVVPLQTVLFVTVVTLAEGLTIIVYVNGDPLHVIEFVYCGVTVIVAVIGVVPLFMARKDGIVSVPFPINPIEGALFIQLKTVVPPVLLVVKEIAGTVSPLHTIIFETLFT